MKIIKVLGIAILLMASMPSQIFAHALWKPGSITPPRASELISNLKTMPCGGGQLNTDRGMKPKIYQTGESITVEWLETINHRGLFQISLLDKNYVSIPQFGIDNKTPLATANEEIQLQIDDLNDANVSSNTPKLRNTPIIIPSAECAECALQLIQEMWSPSLDTSPRPTIASGGRTYYYSCSDIRIESTNNTVPGEISFPATQSRINNLDNVILNWINPSQLSTDPTNVGFKNVAYRVLILQSSSQILATTAPQDGIKYDLVTNKIIGGATVVYNGNLETATLSLLGNKQSSEQYFKIFTYNVSNLYSNGVESSPTPVVPVQPLVSLSIAQGNQNNITDFDRTKGMITATANITNSVDAETYTYDWTNTNTMLVDQTMDKTDNIFQFDPSALAAANYDISLTATSDISGLTSDAKVMSIKIVIPDPGGVTPPPPTETPATSNNETTTGGCTVSKTAKFDPLLLILTLLSLGFISFRFRKQK